VSELEVLAMEMQGLGRGKREHEEEIEVFETDEKLNKELDEEFWEELFSEKFENELDILTSQGDDYDDDVDGEDHVDVLANHFGYLGSSPK
jgi:heat shock transcription factor